LRRIERSGLSECPERAKFFLNLISFSQNKTLLQVFSASRKVLFYQSSYYFFFPIEKHSARKCSTGASPQELLISKIVGADTTETQNCRIAGIGRDLKRSLNPTPLLKQVPYNTLQR